MQESFGTRFQRLRKEAGLTQEEVAKELNITPQAVSKWENDLSAPDISALPALAELLHVTTDELLGKERAVIYVPPKEQKNFDRLMFRMRVLADDAKVNFNLPLALVRIFLQNGGTIPQLGNNAALQNIDWSQILSLVEQGVLGKLMEVEAEDTTVEIWVE